MLRQNLNMEGRIVRQCKVRKRGSTSSSSSSLVQNYRLKRAILVGKRGGSSTPVPMWKTNSSRSPSLQNDKSFKFLAAKGGEKGKDLSVSARKLAATLWEINGVPTPKVKDGLEDRRSEVELRRKDRILKASKLSSMALQLSDPSFSPVSERMGQSKEGSHRRRGSVGSQKLLSAECNVEVFDTLQNASRTEVDQALPHGQALSGHITGVKKRLKDVRESLRTSKELLKVLNKLWGLEEHNSTTASLFAALKSELDRSCIQVNKLIQQERSNGAEIDLLVKQLEEEKAVRKAKEQNRIHNAITSIAGELETEKKLRRQTERLNKKLGRELADTKASLSRATKELESEKRAREILEQVCDELARGIGEDRAEVEELKRQSAKVCEEVEKEREMLQLADILREERVQMKLSEAKYEFEEKSALVDRLRNELEAYLKTKVGEERVSGSPNFERIKELEKYLRETLPNTCQYEDKEKEDEQAANGDEQGEEDDDSADSDLHSIELNMVDENKNYEWSEAVQNGSKRKSVDEKRKDRGSTSEKIQRQSISLERVTSDGIEWEFSPRKANNPDAFHRKKLFEFCSAAWRKDCDDEIERYNMIKDLRDHIVSSAQTASSCEFASPTKKWEQQHTLPSQEPNRVMSQDLTILQSAV